jgi:hypothetical protein
MIFLSISLSINSIYIVTFVWEMHKHDASFVVYIYIYIYIYIYECHTKKGSLRIEEVTCAVVGAGWINEIKICASAVIRVTTNDENGHEKQRSVCERKDLSRISGIRPCKLKGNN